MQAGVSVLLYDTLFEKGLFSTNIGSPVKNAFSLLRIQSFASIQLELTVPHCHELSKGFWKRCQRFAL